MRRSGACGGGPCGSSPAWFCQLWQQTEETPMGAPKAGFQGTCALFQDGLHRVCEPEGATRGQHPALPQSQPKYQLQEDPPSPTGQRSRLMSGGTGRDRTCSARPERRTRPAGNRGPHLPRPCGEPQPSHPRPGLGGDCRDHPQPPPPGLVDRGPGHSARLGRSSDCAGWENGRAGVRSSGPPRGRLAPPPQPPPAPGPAPAQVVRFRSVATPPRPGCPTCPHGTPELNTQSLRSLLGRFATPPEFKPAQAPPRGGPALVWGRRPDGSPRG
ncbi:PREDICTED: basic salivary proline-rich protein 2-like [Ceratotherium simum simum]|uniref:Basic salivary proline-rich protein 2-like n=1 Tax=Ceratotherium simum simum TaxID=73337 RepID=A0ABM1DLN8_CERSS|nr:PREDICTED: basic salivary proline-rich protein 2-like [Ceratotherium simum simum]